MVTLIDTRARLLLDEEIANKDDLVDTLKNITYKSLDNDIPCIRFRGNSISKNSDGVKILGWQRNVSRLQKMDVSLPTVISMTLSNDLEIKEISLDPDFKGSKGITCHHGYLEKNLKEILTGKTFDKSLIEDMQTDKLHCFHLTEVLLGMYSSYNYMIDRNENYLFEEECLDGIFMDNDYLMTGVQYIDSVGEKIYYSIKFEDAKNNFYIDSSGMVLTGENCTATFMINDEEMFTTDFSAKNQRELFIKANRLCLGGLKEINKKFFPEFKSKIMFSNLYVPAFIGLLIQSFSMKLYHNNLNQVLHSLDTIQRQNNTPLCVGAILNTDEASKYFPKFNLDELF